MRSLNLVIPEDAAQQLERLAARDFRRPRDEAALLLVQAVRRAAIELVTGDSEIGAPDDATRGSSTQSRADA